MIAWNQGSSWTIVVFLSMLIWSSSFGWRWRTDDAIVQDVWSENEPIKFKRASASSTDATAIPTSKIEVSTPPVDQDQEESMLVFEGHYFKPNEVPPPPPFMVGDSNWLGGKGGVLSAKIKQSHQPKPKSSSSSSSSTGFYYAVGKGSRFPPSPQKFTEENAKGFDNKSGKNETKSTSGLAEERISSSNSKNVVASSPIQLMDDIIFHDEDVDDSDVTEEVFQNAPKCFTATDTPGRCVLFRQCYPVVFNVINGDLRNPGLAKLLYQSSGPCNATLELAMALSKLKDDKAFLNVKFYNQSICCPGFKHPPSLIRSWENDLRSTRLINNDKHKPLSSSSSQSSPPASILISSREGSSTSSAKGYLSSTKVSENSTAKDEPDLGITFMENTGNPVGMDESSVEISQIGFTGKRDDSNEEDVTQADISMLDDDHDISIFSRIDDDEDENISMVVNAEIVKENSTHVSASIVEDTPEKENDDTFLMEERRGNRDKENSDSSSNSGEKSPANAFLSIPSPNLTPNKCRHQIYGMPRGHWPWMVALVISSRHICSGALISERHIITAAHCVYLLSETDVKKLRIIIGDRVMYSSVDGPHFWRKVSKIITHVNYNQQTFAGDIAILKMNSDVPFSRNVQPITLSDLVSPVDGSTFSKGIVAGWSGADIGQASFEARVERETVVEIMDKSECRERYRGFALSGVATNTFCTKAVNNTCVADSGAPLIVRVQNCWVLAGIMSWGLGCSHFPEVYSDVTRFNGWIRKHAV